MIKAILLLSGALAFEHDLRCVGIRLEESVFIDNPLENLISPSALGMSVVFHDDEKTICGSARVREWQPRLPAIRCVVPTGSYDGAPNKSIGAPSKLGQVTS
ncbi:hypothetical protein [Burkholderia ambifaria]|uniref:hypothetical protein n=1 Tax=Burkholderia ambifaria TaxID=152480 RepID=UPI0015893138|nr:hypothetical protein [Burkholderia ambifaria]